MFSMMNRWIQKSLLKSCQISSIPQWSSDTNSNVSKWSMHGRNNLSRGHGTHRDRTNVEFSRNEIPDTDVKKTTLSMVRRGAIVWFELADRIYGEIMYYDYGESMGWLARWSFMGLHYPRLLLWTNCVMTFICFCDSSSPLQIE